MTNSYNDSKNNNKNTGETHDRFNTGFNKEDRSHPT